MKRSIFFIIIAVLNGFFGLYMMLGTSTCATQFGIDATPQALSLLRNLGTILFSLAVLDFMARNEPDSKSMRAILVFNLLGHGLGIVFMCIDLMNGVIEFAKVAPGMAVPAIGTIGSLIYLLKMKIVASEK